MIRLLSLIIGYGCGNFMTAELVTRHKTGKSAREIGSGNPGMANMIANFGVKTGILVLAGDTGKTVLACLIVLLLFPQQGRILMMYAGIGACLGHNYPVWMKGRGGKGVAVTCMLLLLYSPLFGLLSDVAGMLVVFVTGFLPLGAVLIPAVFLVPAVIVYGKEATILTIVLLGLMVVAHWPGLKRVFRGEEKPILKLYHKKNNLKK